MKTTKHNKAVDNQKEADRSFEVFFLKAFIAGVFVGALGVMTYLYIFAHRIH